MKVRILMFFLLICFTIVIYKHCYAYSGRSIEYHHIFPRQYSPWFFGRDINPDLYTIAITKKQHFGKGESVHHHRYVLSGGKNYNDSWHDYIKYKNPNASKAQCFVYAAMLLSEYGISLEHKRFFNYVTKTLSGKKLPDNMHLRKSLEIIRNIAQKGERFLRSSPYIWIAIEVYNFCEEFDDAINEEYFEKAVSKLSQISDIEISEDNSRNILEKVAAGYVFLGMAFYDDVLRPTTSFYAEVASHFDSKREKKLRLSLDFFIKAHNINKKLGDNLPSIPLRIGLLHYLLDEKNIALPYLLEAKKGFADKKDFEMADTISSMLAQ